METRGEHGPEKLRAGRDIFCRKWSNIVENDPRAISSEGAVKVAISTGSINWYEGPEIQSTAVEGIER